MRLILLKSAVCSQTNGEKVKNWTLTIVVASVSSQKDTYLDKSSELPEDIQNIFYGVVDKYIDLDKEDKIDPNSPKKQELLQRKETEKGSFFGVMLEGRTNTFLDANPKATQMIEKLKTDNATLLETINKLETRIENILEIREEENEVKRHLELLVEESRGEIAHFLEQIKILKDEKDEQATLGSAPPATARAAGTAGWPRWPSPAAAGRRRDRPGRRGRSAA